MRGYVIDSSGWLEYFSNGKKANLYLKYFRAKKPLWSPSLVLYEVYKKLCQQRSEADGLLAITQIEERSESIVPLDDHLALHAADISLKHKLAMADAIIYATTLQQEATLVTSDHHFEGLHNVVIL